MRRVNACLAAKSSPLLMRVSWAVVEISSAHLFGQDAHPDWPVHVALADKLDGIGFGRHNSRYLCPILANQEHHYSAADRDPLQARWMERRPVPSASARAELDHDSRSVRKAITAACSS